jgi:hypothetical protein
MRSLPAAGGRRRRPARQAGLELVEKLLTKLTSTDTTERNAMLRIPAPSHRFGLARGRQRKSMTKAWPPAASQACAWGMAHIHQPLV